MATHETTGGGRDARRWLVDLAARERRLLGLAVAAGGVATLASIGQLGLLARGVSALLVEGAARDELLPTLVAMALLLLVRAVALHAQERFGQVASLRIRAGVRAVLLDQLARLGPGWLSGGHSASLASQLVEQVEALDGYFARFRPQLALSVLSPALVLGVALWLDWLAALFLLLAAPLIPLFMALVGMGAERLNRDQFAAVARLSGHFIDRVRAITTLQLFGHTRAATREVHAAADDYRRRSMRTLRLAFLSSAVLEFFASVAIAVVAIYVGFGLLGYITYGPSPEVTLFSGLLILLLAPEFFQPLRTLSQHYHDRAAALGAGAEILARLQEPVSGAGNVQVQTETAAAEDTIALGGVSLRYSDSPPVFGQLDMQVKRGEVIALTGPSGGGKSSLLHLLAGFIRPNAGTISVFGQPAGSSPFGWLGQKGFWIQGSWADNLRLSSPEASDIAIENALRMVGLAELL